MINFFKRQYGTFSQYVFFRYLIAGGTSATVDLFSLYILNSRLHVHYLPAAIFAFIIAFGVSFSLHKYWTFKSKEVHDTKKQLFLYFATSLVGLALNTFLIYIFVHYFHIQVILSQIFVGGIVACCTYFLSRRFVFTSKAI